MAEQHPPAQSEANRIDPTGETGGEPVRLTDLSKRYGDTVAVDDVSLAVDRGELLVLLGPSGCGKTTTLRMIAGLESVTSGSVEIGGTEVSMAAPQDRDVAMVFQNYALYPHKTVRENIAFPLRKLSLDAADREQRIESTASLLGIADLLEKEPAALSGGQRQRVAIGRAIAREPSVLLMDEPLSNLDAKLRVQTRAELRSLQQRLGITTVYVTHDQEEAMSIADRIAIMNKGTVEQVGTPEEVYTDPTSTFIADFLGDPSMNLFTLSADGARDDLVMSLAADAPSNARTVGIRPEDVSVAPTADAVDESSEGDIGPVECHLSVVEPIGRAYELTLEADGRQFVTREREVLASVRDRERVVVSFNGDRLYYFDGDGQRIRDARKRT